LATSSPNGCSPAISLEILFKYESFGYALNSNEGDFFPPSSIPIRERSVPYDNKSCEKEILKSRKLITDNRKSFLIILAVLKIYTAKLLIYYYYSGTELLRNCECFYLN
jgi:hypothetical protein